MCCLQYENDNYVDMKKGMPDVSERIGTPDGDAIVFDVNILEDRIKTRLVLEERDGDRPEKLSSEYYFYSKEDIKRREKRKSQPEQKSAKKKPRSRKPDAPDESAFAGEEEAEAPVGTV
jgi:hypothetical protein